MLDTSSADLIADLFVPLLHESVLYDRGVGYFSSGWFRIAAEGMAAFAGNGGRARWVTSPILDPADWEALQTGDAARTDPLLYVRLQTQIADMAETLARDTLSAIAWMVPIGSWILSSPSHARSMLGIAQCWDSMWDAFYPLPFLCGFACIYQTSFMFNSILASSKTP